jgi:predicted secreted protein
MFGKTIIVIILAQPLIFSWGCHVNPSSNEAQHHMKVDQTHNNQTISIALKDTVSVVLNEVPTSGYRWEVESYPEELVEPLEDEYRSGNTQGAGGGGKHYFKFRPKKAGKGTLNFVNRQQWPGGETGDHFTLHLVVE